VRSGQPNLDPTGRLAARQEHAGTPSAIISKPNIQKNQQKPSFPNHLTVHGENGIHAGRTVCTFPLTVGSFSATMTRSGATVATAQSNADVTESPYTQDLQYRVVGGLR
jgi:hypothetical protein